MSNCSLCRVLINLLDLSSGYVVDGLGNTPSIVDSPSTNEVSNTVISFIECNGICVKKAYCENGVKFSSFGVSGKRKFDPLLLGKNYCKSPENCCNFKFDEIKEEDPEDNEVETNEIPNTAPRRCGKRKFPERRISFGKAAGYAEFPWMIVILSKNQYPTKKSTAYSYKCGGSLIHPAVVLTAAHCVHSVKPGKLVVRAGAWDLGRGNEEQPHQDRKVHSAVIHKGFERKTLQYDIALLILATPVELTENVNTICLPQPNSEFDSTSCLVSGWGKDSYGVISSYQSVLKKARIPIIPNTNCQQHLRKTDLGDFFKLHRSFICAGGVTRDSCGGDGGSPFFCQHSEHKNYYQVGLVSWAVSCSQITELGIYANIVGVRSWIDLQMKTRNLELSYYIE